MKRMLATVLILSVLLGCAAAMADDTGIQIIGAPEVETGAVNLDDWKENQTAIIPGFGNITLDSVQFLDTMGSCNDNGTSWSSTGFSSGSSADYLRIRIYVLNTQKQAFDFLKTIGDNIVCSFGDGYQFGGWKRQEYKCGDKTWVMYGNKDVSRSIGSLYDGYFDVVVTLPNYVVASKEPLSVSFSIGESEFTVNVRK